MDLAERIGLLDRSSGDGHCIDPEELHFSNAADSLQEFDVDSSQSSAQGTGRLSNLFPAQLDIANDIGSISSVESKHSVEYEPADGRSSRAYAPRASAVERKSTKAALRVRPRNGQHARELERNRQAAANYRSRQKNQLDSLLTRVREEEDKMVKQKSMVYSLKEELWHLRNNLMARQQIQIFGARSMANSGLAGNQSSIFESSNVVHQAH
jgi:hypothetical protein